jgi:hypothetical protein
LETTKKFSFATLKSSKRSAGAVRFASLQIEFLLDKNCASKPVAVGQFVAIKQKLLDQKDSCSRKFVGSI